jgi:hypothetical protein
LKFSNIKWANYLFDSLNNKSGFLAFGTLEFSKALLKIFICLFDDKKDVENTRFQNYECKQNLPRELTFLDVFPKLKDIYRTENL